MSKSIKIPLIEKLHAKVEANEFIGPDEVEEFLELVKSHPAYAGSWQAQIAAHIIKNTL